MMFAGCNPDGRPGGFVGWMKSGPESGTDGTETFQGVVEFDERVLAFEVAGRVSRLAIHRGESVAAGAVVATLDPEMFTLQKAAREADLAIAEARLALLRAGVRKEDIRAAEMEVQALLARENELRDELARTTKLLGTGAATETLRNQQASALAETEARRAQAEARLAAARAGSRTQDIAAGEGQVASVKAALALEQARLERVTITAPATGTVLATYILEGEVVAAGTPVARVADTTTPFVDVYVPQARVAMLAIGATAQVDTDGPEAPFHARIEEIGRTLEFTPQFIFSERERPNLMLRVRVRVEVPKDRALPAGLPVHVRFDGAATALSTAAGTPR